MSNASSIDAFLSQANEKEKAYDWLGAVEAYKAALGSVPTTDFIKLGQIQERMGYAFHKAAMQAESVEQFRKRMPEATACFERTKEFYSRLSEPEKKPRMVRCDAMIAYMGYWLASEASEKRMLINECWKLTKEALRAFKEEEDALEYGRTYNLLAWSAGLSWESEEDFQVQEVMVKEAVEHGEQAIKFLSICGDSNELARAYVNTLSFLGLFGYFFHDLDGREKCFQKAKDFWQKATELSEEVAFLELSSGMEELSLDWGLGTDKTLKNLDKELEYARRTRDRFRIGYVLEMLGGHAFWRALVEAPDEALKSRHRALECIEEAKRQYSIISYVGGGTGVLWVEAPYAEHYWELASWETDLDKRRELLGKAVDAIPDLLSRAKRSVVPGSLHYAHHVISKVLTSQAMMETSLEEKQRLLEKALKHRKEALRYIERHAPFGYWNRGVMQIYLASTKYQLSDLSNDLESKKSMLQEAAADAENGLKFCLKDLAFQERRGVISTQYYGLGNWQYGYGYLLKLLYDVTHNMEYLVKAIETFENSAESMQKLHLISRVAESNWKIAQMHDALGNHLKAAESFDLASNNYKSAADKIPQLKDFYQEHATYMQAWSEIEKARHDHLKQEYGSAEEHFNKAASLHKTLKQWSYLAPNYEAWTRVEHAEELSRKEQSEEAIKAFQQATKSFEETKKSLQTELGKIEDLVERQMANNVLTATDLRHEYCLGRIALEEAKIFDKKGEHYSSSEKYGLASRIFEKITQALEAEQDRKEFRLITTLSQAWAKMTQAEAEESSNLYAEAAQLFEQARELSPSEKARMLAQGHSRFCRALEAGTKFADAKDQTSQAAFMQNLEDASNYYVKAGFRNASEYAKATKLLFDAYLYMGNAQKESDPEKKAKLYTMAEKILQTSAGSFMKAEHPEKREQVLRLLEKVKEERELALSLSEVLHAPSIVSTTTAFTTPTPTQENAVGSERFEHADIQANLIARQKELKVGENLGLEIELVNAGRGPALLTKITELVPRGFELAEKPEIYRVEDSYIDMKGKRLDPLKMVEVKLILKPRVQGAFPIKPRVLYIDEDGKYKSHEPEPVTITVKELGIKGWIKGER